LKATEATLIDIGLTRAKQATIANVAKSILDETLNLETINQLDATQAIEQLTALKGIGPWTAEVYLLFCAGHPDIFAAGDLALREAVRHAYNMEDRPSEKELRREKTLSIQNSISVTHLLYLIANVQLFCLVDS